MTPAPLNPRGIAKAMRHFAEQAARHRLIDHRARANLLAQPQRFARIEMRMTLLADRVQQWSTSNAAVDSNWPMTEIVLRGIALRLPTLGLMLNQRLQTPDASSLWNSSSSTQQ